MPPTVREPSRCAEAIPPRYRLEGGRTCTDIKLRNADQLFDGRDPAPFHERDLDEDAAEYILGAVPEITPRAPTQRSR